MKPTIIKGLRVVGVATRTTFAAEADPELSRAYQLWDQFEGHGLCYQIPRRIKRGEFVELYTEYEPGAQAEFTLFLGQRVFEFIDLPEGTIPIEVPPQQYLKFVVKGHEDVFARLWSKVESFFTAHPMYERAWTTDFAFSGYQPDKTTLYVAIK